MRKGHYTMITLGLAGIIAAGGTGMLSQKISNAMAEEVITAVKNDTGTCSQLNGTANWQEQDSETEVFHKKYGIYLPASAEIMEETKDSLTIRWNGNEFIYHLDHSERQTKSDIDPGNAVSIAAKAVQKYGKRDVKGKRVDISLQKNLLPEEAFLGIDENAAVVNRKNYGVRYYAVDISGMKLHQYSLCINSVTGEVFGYVDYHDRGADAEYGGEFEQADLEKLKPEFEMLAEKFVDENLNLAEAKAYDFVVDLMETENVCREVFAVHCRTAEDDNVVVTFDPAEKTVLCFEINPIF